MAKLDFKVRQKIFILTCCSLFGISTPGQAAWLEANGSLRTLGGYSDHYDFPLLFGNNNSGDFLSYSQARLILAGKPPVGDLPISYEIHGVADYLANTQSQTANVQGFTDQSAYQITDASWTPLNHEHQHVTLGFDRFQVKLGLPSLDISVGRQPIDFSKTYFWNVLDVFRPFSANQYDRDYKKGVDTLRLDIPLGQSSGINLIGALGRRIASDNPAWQGAAVFGRGFINLKGFDVSAQGGKVRGGYHSGLGIVGELGGLETRAEGAWFLADDHSILLPNLTPYYKSHFSSVVGVGRHFQNTLDLQAEYFFNGGGSEKGDFNAAFWRAANGDLLNWGKHLMGGSIAYEFLPILTGQLGYLFSFTDYSSELLPQLKWSVSDNVDALAGALTHFGKRPNGLSVLGPNFRSEFASQSDFYYVQLKVYF